MPLISSKNWYNILSIDGGGIRGIIPCMVLQQMEQYAFEYAKSKGFNVKEYPGHPGRMALKDVFDMFAGTSTGSILAAGFSYPLETKPEQPKFFA